MTAHMGCTTVVVTGSARGVGTTTVAAAIAKAFDELETATGEQVTVNVSPPSATPPPTFAWVVDVRDTSLTDTMNTTTSPVVVPVVVTRASVEALLATDRLLGQLPDLTTAHVAVAAAHSQAPAVIEWAAREGASHLGEVLAAGKVHYFPWDASVELLGAQQSEPAAAQLIVAAQLIDSSLVVSGPAEVAA